MAFQETADVSVGINWGWEGLADADLLGDLEGRDVLELGCGGGQDTVGLAEHGANVTGIDLSRPQLAHADALTDEHGADADLVMGDVTTLPFADDRFDLAFNTWVFQWVADLQGCFRETRRVLRAGGRFVFSMPHPFFTVVDPDSHEVVRSYLDTGRQVRPDEREGRPDLVTYRRRVSDIANGLREAGFDVDRLLEPGSSDPDDHEPGPWGESPPELRAKVPRVLVVEASLEG